LYSADLDLQALKINSFYLLKFANAHNQRKSSPNKEVVECAAQQDQRQAYYNKIICIEFLCWFFIYIKKHFIFL